MTDLHARHIRAVKPSRDDKSSRYRRAEPFIRVEPSHEAKPLLLKPSRKEYSLEYSQFNHSEPTSIQKWFLDRFTHFWSRLEPTQTGSLLFGPFWIHQWCLFCEKRRQRGWYSHFKIQWLQKMLRHSFRSWPEIILTIGASKWRHFLAHKNA